MLALLFAAAHAIPDSTQVDCTPDKDPALCASVDNMIEHANTAFGSDLISTASTGGRHPDSVYARMEVLMDVVQANPADGCTLDGEIGAAYHVAWSGTATTLATAPTVHAASSIFNINRAARKAAGTVTGIANLGVPFFGQWNTYNGSRQWVATTQLTGGATRFWAGRYVRGVGRRGVFVGAYVSCNAGVDPALLLESWFADDLSSYVQ